MVGKRFETGFEGESAGGDQHMSVVALFSSIQKLFFFKFFQSYQILWHIYRALNIDKKITNCTICLEFTR